MIRFEETNPDRNCTHSPLKIFYSHLKCFLWSAMKQSIKFQNFYKFSGATQLFVDGSTVRCTKHIGKSHPAVWMPLLRQTESHKRFHFYSGQMLSSWKICNYSTTKKNTEQPFESGIYLNAALFWFLYGKLECTALNGLGTRREPRMKCYVCVWHRFWLPHHRRSLCQLNMITRYFSVAFVVLRIAISRHPFK